MFINLLMTKSIFFIALLFLVCSCFRNSYQVEVQTLAEINELGDYTFSIIHSEKMDEVVEKDIHTILQKKGFISTKKDFRFAIFYTIFPSKVRLNSIDNYYNSGIKSQVLVSNLKPARTMLIQVMDTEKQTIVFHVTISGFKDAVISRNQFKNILQKAFHDFSIEHKPLIFVSNV